MNYFPNSDAELASMLKSISIDDFEELLKDIPAGLRYRQPLNLPDPLSEPELVSHMAALAGKNIKFRACFAGGGAYDHYIPAAIWKLVSRSEFITAYTPYQAEVSQGTLQAAYEFQSMISQLTGLPVTNASMYDCASAIAEAALLAARHTGKNQILISATTNPHYVDTVRTYLSGTGLRIVVVPMADGLTDNSQLLAKIGGDTAAVIIQSPNFLGLIENIDEISMDIKRIGGLLIMVYDPISLGILKSPADYGADIACGEGQPLGLPLAFGGPYLGLFSVKSDLVRKMPGRLVSRTVDNNGRPGFVLTLQTREQHIRREKATSNICTNQQLCALAATIYLALMGKSGIKHAAELCLAKAHFAAEKLSQIPGFRLRFTAPYFKEFVLQTPVPPKRIIEQLMKRNILAGIDLGGFKIGLKGCLLVAVTEKVTYEQIDEFAFWLGRVK